MRANQKDNIIVMKKLLRNLDFWFEYYVGVHLTNAKNLAKWHDYIINKYPEKFNKKQK